MKKKLTMEELEERIRVLEARLIVIPPAYYYPYPVPPSQPIYRCPVCGSSVGCMHVTC